MTDDIYHRMYSATPVDPAKAKPALTPEKMATRVLGGMKAQNSHTVLVEVDGSLVNLPKTEYVKLLEDQVKQLRDTTRNLESKNNRLNAHVKRVMEDIRALQAEMKNKVNLR